MNSFSNSSMIRRSTGCKAPSFSDPTSKADGVRIPGIPPTNKKLEIPMTAIVNIRGDRLYHEHISWDQGTVLVQLGLMPEYLPFPYQLPDGRTPAEGKRFEIRVPSAGVEAAAKMRDRNAVGSNKMFEFGIREV